MKLMPAVGSVIRKDDYLPLVDTHKKRYDSNLYDYYGFISLHKALFSIGMWTLCAPLSLCKDGSRPDFENFRGTFTETLMKAIDLAVENNTFVVIVDDPITGKTMQPSRLIAQI